MPYIEKEERKRLDIIAAHSSRSVATTGQLNYLITKILLEFVDGEKPCYQTYLEAIGTLDCVKLELYRRRIVPYEDKKKKQNGDLY